MEKLLLLEELIMRWKRHRDIVNTLEKTNLDTETLELWKRQIEVTFLNCLKSNL